MRWQLLAVGILMALGSGTASAQGMIAPNYYPGPIPQPYPQQWQQVRSKWIDVNCTPTRIVYLAPRPPVLPPTYNTPWVNPWGPQPPFQPVLPVMPLVAGAAQPMANLQVPAVAGLPAVSPPVAAAPAPATPQRLAFTTPAPTRTEPVVSKPATEVGADEEAARKLKLARYLEQDGMGAKARQRYQEIVQKFPNTPAAEEARQLLGQGG